MRSVEIADNGSGLCEVAVNRRRKFRFRRHVAKANFLFAKLQKKPIKLAFADYEAESFNLDLTPPFCKTLVSSSVFLYYFSNCIEFVLIKFTITSQILGISSLVMLFVNCLV